MNSVLLGLAGRARGMLAALAVILAACGGGGGGSNVAGVGSGGSGIASGSVTGFGSIIVDGVEYDDSNATRQAQDAAGGAVNAAVKLGQRVRLVYSGANVAASIEVQAQLAGPVTAAPAPDGTLAVMGQTVRIVAGGADASQSSPTVLDGYAAAAEIAAGDDVEVHGAWVFDAVAATNVLVATRIEKLAEAADPVQLGGVAVAIDGATLRLNSASGTQIAAALPALAVGDVVRVWAARSALAAAPVQAMRVAGNPISVADLAGNASVSLSGLASNFDAAARTLDVQGVRVRVPEGVAMDAAALARGEFVTVRMSGGMGMVASAVTLRSGQAGADLGRTVQVNGVTSGIDWSAASVAFNLRAAAIEADAAVIADSCRVVGPLANVYVQVRGTLAQSGAVVTAAAVSCMQSLPGTVMASYRGMLTAVNPAAQTLSLTTGMPGMPGMAGHALNATWDARTYFEKHPASLPIGLRVEVEGVLVQGSNTLRLSRVSLVR